MFVVKRDNTLQKFDVNKIRNAIKAAFNSVDQTIDDETLTLVINELSLKNMMYIEDIQNQIEQVLMSLDYFDAGKAFMLYRQKRKELRELTEKKEFLRSYADASNAATGSKYDANANVENKNIATLNGEL